MLKEKQVKFQTLFPAKLQVMQSDGTTIYESAREATEELIKRGYAIRMSPAPTTTTLKARILQITWSRSTRNPFRGDGGPVRPSSYKEKI